MKELAYRAVFFLYGGSINYLLFKWYVSFAYPLGSSNRFVVGHPLTNVCAFVLPGLAVSWLMARLRTKFKQSPRNGRRVIVRGGFYGILATVLALEIFYFSSAIYVVACSGSGDSFSAKLGLIPLALIDIQTYGMEPIIRALPFAFAYGALAGAFILKTIQRHSSETGWERGE
jgi:hypothetical protein